MNFPSKILAAAALASLVAACSGGTQSALPGNNANAAPDTGLSMTSAFTAIGDDGSTLHVYPTREFLASYHSLQTPGGSVTTMAGSNLTYHGGPVETAPKIYVVFWGSAWNGSGDPNHEATLLKNWYTAMGGSHWLNTTTQYTQSGGSHVGNQTGQLGGSYVDTSNTPPSRPTQSQMGAEAVRAATHFGVKGANASIIVAMPHGVHPSGFGTQYCAYHTSQSGNGGTVSWTNLPYMSDAGSSCGAGSVNSPGTEDGVTIVGGHEQAETATDPQPNSGWLDSSGSEIGDKCAWINLENNPNAGGYPTQPLWSNHSSSCVQSY